MKTKFLIQGPRDRDKVVSLFPFFIKLNELFPDAEVNVIIDKGLEDVLELLPHKVRIYPLPADLNTIVGIHKFAVNVTDVFNIDHFFDFSFDYKGALTGFCFRAKNRVGENSGGKRLLYTKKMDIAASSAALDSISINYLNTVLDKEMNDFFYKLPESEDNQAESNVHQLFETEKPNFFLLKNTDKDFELWKEFLLLMESGIAVIWDMKNLSLWQEFKSDENLKVELIIQGEVEGQSFLPELIKKSEYVITDDKSLAHACIFFEKRAFLFSEDSYTRIHSNYFSSVEDLIITEDNDVVEIFKDGKKKEIRVMDEVLDLIHDVMKL
ncbi:glycosyltransferase family 9 protein [Halobacteriovorax sp.]|uniref:glycosyltransferase family 9 protein n=1 Tax=Halobacteriovorax sp. TaxID=2020862 RepID=UPI00356AF14B